MNAMLSSMDVEIRRLLRRALRAENKRTIECVGKIRFEGFADAQRVARKRYESVHTGRVPYRCPSCGWWHLGRKKD